MATLVIDTYNLVSTLKSSGFSEEQASGISRALKEVDLEHVVTKQYLKTELKDLELRITTRLGGIMMAGVAFLAALKFFG